MNPLNIGITDPEVRHQRIETIILFPRDCRDDTSGSGGHCVFVLPHRGYLSPDCRIILPATCAELGYDYPPNVGVFSLIKSATLRVGSVVVSQLNNAAQYYALKHNLKPLEHREKVDEPLHGMKFSFEGCSGCNKQGFDSGREIFSGQHRIVASDGYEPKVGDQQPATSVPPPVQQGKFYKAYKLSETYNDTDEDAGTPEYQIELSQLFPNFFGKRIEIPLQLINPDDEVTIEIVWTDNSTWGKNERAVLYPNLATDTDPSSARCLAYQAHDATQPNNTSRGAGFAAGGDIAAAGEESFLEMGGTQAAQVQNKIVVTRAGATAPVTGLRLAATLNNGAGFGGVNGYLEKIRVLDGGQGLEEGDIIRIAVGNGAASNNDCVLVVCSRIKNIVPAPIQPAAGIPDIAAFTNPQNLNLGSGGGNLAAGQNGGFISAGGAGYAAGQLIQMKNQMDESKALFNVVALSVNGGAVTACRLASEDDANKMLMNQTFAAGTSNSYAAVAGGLVIQVRAEADADGNIDGLYGLKHSLFEYDTLATGGKINIVADKVRMITDLVHYEDGRMENDAKKMMGEGLQMIYGELRNVETTLTTNGKFNDTAGNSNPSNAATQAAEHTRQIGLSNEVLRDIVIADSPDRSLRDSKYFPHKGLANLNPLLLQYCSRDSLKEDGNKLQVTINSVPRFPAPLNQSAHFYNELRNVYGMPFYSPEGLYNGYTSCKQEDNDAIANTAQPGFVDNDGRECNEVTSQQYQLNDRKMGMTNQELEGVSQKSLNGMGHYYGLDFKIGGQANFSGNGIAIGSQAVQLDYTYTATQDPQFQGNSTLNCWAEVERYFQLKGGVVSVSAASM